MFHLTILLKRDLRISTFQYNYLTWLRQLITVYPLGASLPDKVINIYHYYLSIITISHLHKTPYVTI